MQFKLNRVLKGILLVISCAAFADEPVNDGSNASNDLNNLAIYLQNLGEYFGYDLTQYCTTGGPCSPPAGGETGGTPANTYSNALFNENATYTAQLNMFNSYIGSLIGGGSSNTQNFNPIVPENSTNYAIINSMSGQTFSVPPYASTSNSGISVSPLIDQQTYQNDPVSQAVLNIIATPDYTFCQQNGSTTYTNSCAYLFRELIMTNVTGTLPGTQEVFTASYNQPFVPQLNTDTLISPLQYSTTVSVSAPPTTGSGDANPGLIAQSQAQQAANFIRYVTGSVNPISLLDRNTYDNLINVAENFSESKTITVQQQLEAKTQLNNYLTKLKTYAAQTSVPVSNLYYILSRRMGQNPASGSGPQMSQALNEYIMASWRLYNPNPQGDGKQSNQQWLTQINQGSAASVQKEIAILLSEINYQLYLSRQLQERMLLTQSVGVIQNTLLSQPSANTVSPASSNASGTGTSSTQ